MSDRVPKPESDKRLRQRVESLEDEVSLLHRRLQRAESRLLSPTFRESTRRFFDTRKKKAGQILLHSPFHPLYLWLFRPNRPTNPTGAAFNYLKWVAADEASLATPDWYRQQAKSWRFQPMVSIVVPTFRPKEDWLQRAIASVKAQSYESWQLCICDDASGDPRLTEYLRAEAEADSRIRVVFSAANGGIAAALNEAGKLASGEYVAFLDHDDELHPLALHHAVEACQDEEVDVLYSDEDHLDPAGRRATPSFKPDWSPELLQCCMYFGHLLVARRELIQDVGWFRPGFDGAQDFDLALRLVERARKIHHLRRILYHWRQHPQSTSMNPKAKPYAHEAGRRALAEAMVRRRIDSQVEDGPFLYTFFIARPPSRSTVSVIVCPTDVRRFAAFLEGWRQIDARNARLVVVESAGRPNRKLSGLIGKSGCLRIAHEGAWNLSLMNNRGAQATDAAHLVFLSEGVTPKRKEWLVVMTANLDRPEIGVVGGRVLESSGAIQDAGVVVGLDGVAGHPGRGLFATDLMYYINLPRDVSAVSGTCLGIRRELFDKLGRFDPAFPNHYYDLDLCLRVRSQGARIIVDPRIELRNDEATATDQVDSFEERQLLRQRWAAVLSEPDPYYPAAFDRATQEIRLPQC